MKFIKYSLLVYAVIVFALASLSAVSLVDYAEKNRDVVYSAGVADTFGNEDGFELGTVYIEVVGVDGTVKQTAAGHNRGTRILENHTRDGMGDLNATGSSFPLKSIQFSTDSALPTINVNTCPSGVTGLGLDPVNVTTRTKYDEGNLTLYHSFSCTGTTNNLQKICVSNHTNMNYIFATTLFTPVVNCGNGDTLNINWSIDFQA